MELADLEKQPDPKPIEAMQPCAESLTVLPADLIDRPVEEAVKLSVQGMSVYTVVKDSVGNVQVTQTPMAVEDLN